MRMLCKGLYCRAAPGAGAPGAHPPLAARHCALTCSLPPPACRVPLPVPCPSRGRLLLLAALALPTHRPGNGVISSAFWLSWNTDTDWTELDVYELGGNATGGPGPGFPYILFMNTHVFRRTGTDITPDTVLSEPCHYVARIPLISRYNVYALDWNAWTISWLFNGRVVRVTENVYHQQDLVLKLDSETMPTWFGLPSGNWRNQTYSVLYLRAWSRTARHVRNDGDGDGTTCHVRTITESRVAPARGHARISKYALQRAPSPGSKQVAGLAEPVPVKGWGAFLGRGPIGRGERFFPPTRVGAA
ncbi:hypothetical protein I4F81_009686 [Pyropia yezoensis]|uniref:Uncharacterized protein n=1 Tax=Pyropia yezoensis TaxID=2788 RepID=A0ACC3CAJ1_PYRYE|nr:hypothetical protein I4F81_009686 [Neopyropia yezoensis]